MATYKELKETIAQGQIKSVIAKLVKSLENNSEYHNEAILLGSRYNSTETNNRKGLISYALMERSQTKITNSLIGLINRLEEENVPLAFQEQNNQQNITANYPFQNTAPSNPKSGNSTVEIILNIPFKEFDKSLLNQCISDILNSLRIPASSIVVFAPTPGSVKIPIELDQNEAQKLIWLTKLGEFGHLNAVDARIYSKLPEESFFPKYLVPIIAAGLLLLGAVGAYAWGQYKNSIFEKEIEGLKTKQEAQCNFEKEKLMEEMVNNYGAYADTIKATSQKREKYYVDQIDILNGYIGYLRRKNSILNKITDWNEKEVEELCLILEGQFSDNTVGNELLNCDSILLDTFPFLGKISYEVENPKSHIVTIERYKNKCLGLGLVPGFFVSNLYDDDFDFSTTIIPGTGGEPNDTVYTFHSRKIGYGFNILLYQPILERLGRNTNYNLMLGPGFSSYGGKLRLYLMTGASVSFGADQNIFATVGGQFGFAEKVKKYPIDEPFQTFPIDFREKKFRGGGFVSLGYRF